MPCSRPFPTYAYKYTVHTYTHVYSFIWRSRGLRVGGGRTRSEVEWQSLEKARKFTRWRPRHYKTFIAQKHLPRGAWHLHANAIVSHLSAVHVFPATQGSSSSSVPVFLSLPLFPLMLLLSSRLLGYLVFLLLSRDLSACAISFLLRH